MRFTVVVRVAAAVGAALAAGLAAEPNSAAWQLAPATEKQIRTFFTTYCQECHGPEKQKGERRFDQLALPATSVDTLIDLQDIIDQLNLGEMPAEEAKRHPAPAEVREIVGQLTQLVTEGRGRLASTGGRTVLRRLSRREYLNTIGDLLGLNMTLFDPTTNFPRDQLVMHMDNIGDALRTSGFLLAQYLDAADQVVEKAFQESERPREQTWRFAGNFKGPPLDYVGGKVHQFRYIVLEQMVSPVTYRGGYGYIYDFMKGVPTDGWYEIRVRAEARNRRNPYDPKIFGRDPEMPFRLGLLPGNVQAGPLPIPQPIEPLLGEAVIADDVLQWYPFRAWLGRGFTPRFVFLNGTLNMGAANSRILRNYGDTFPEDLRATSQVGDNHVAVMRHGQFPQIRIHEVEIRGPLIEQWPSPVQRAIFGDRPFAPERTREILEGFARRAYRRPVRSEEVLEQM
jgi:hypothetical protein